ncbi:hypothetical protein AVEN_189419-1 [Araneus ventricosus]|uniref:Tc1-like transposase DDE domain-containing protein n=1 Tax=Araneus ventricosus TaxID=182803 RepID=A0A4Y2U7S5_ARAVE|nr:hypothetical protein AVEN_189419-1 [Araneus ventricosus]
MLHRIDVDNDFLQRIIFTDEATFHVSGHANKHTTRIWGSENPHFIIETVRDSPKVNVWCGLMADRVIGPFFFAESTVTKEVYLDMLQLFAIPQISHITSFGNKMELHHIGKKLYAATSIHNSLSDGLDEMVH